MGTRLALAVDDDPTLAAWCRELRTHIATADETAVLHRARNTVLRLTLEDGRAVVVKAFAGGFGRSLREVGRGSKARRSFAVARELQCRGVATPDPLAWVEWRRFGLGVASAYVSQAVADARTLHRYLRSGDCAGWERALPAAGRAIAAGHRAGAIHRDLSPGNLICDDAIDDPAAWRLVDLNRLRFGRVTDAIHGATLLDRLEGRSEERHAALLDGYAAAWGTDPEPLIAAQTAARKRWLRASFLKRHSRGLRRRLAGGRAR